MCNRTGVLMIVDAHQHVWDTRELAYPWLDAPPALNGPRLPEDARTPGVDRVVFVQADAADGAAEARWVQSLADDWPELAGIVAFAPVELDGLEAALDDLEQLPAPAARAGTRRRAETPVPRRRGTGVSAL